MQSAATYSTSNPTVIPDGGLATFLTATEGRWAQDNPWVDEYDDIGPTQGIGSVKQVADKIAEFGRNEDTYIVHAAHGETVIPMEVLDADPRLKARLFNQMKDMGIEPERYVVGSELNSINPVTGQPEFFIKKLGSAIWKGVKKVFRTAAQIVLPIVGGMMLGPLGAFVGSYAGTLIAGGNSAQALKAAKVAGITQGVFQAGSAAVQAAGAAGQQAAQAGQTLTAGQKLAAGIKGGVSSIGQGLGLASGPNYFQQFSGGIGGFLKPVQGGGFNLPTLGKKIAAGSAAAGKYQAALNPYANTLLQPVQVTAQPVGVGATPNVALPQGQSILASGAATPGGAATTGGTVNVASQMAEREAYIRDIAKVGVNNNPVPGDPLATVRGPNPAYANELAKKIGSPIRFTAKGTEYSIRPYGGAMPAPSATANVASQVAPPAGPPAGAPVPPAGAPVPPAVNPNKAAFDAMVAKKDAGFLERLKGTGGYFDMESLGNLKDMILGGRDLATTRANMDKAAQYLVDSGKAVDLIQANAIIKQSYTPGLLAKWGPAGMVVLGLVATEDPDQPEIPQITTGFDVYDPNIHGIQQPNFGGYGASFAPAQGQGSMAGQAPALVAGGGGMYADFPRRDGPIYGPGTETSDDIPAMLSDGEFVMTSRAVRGAGGGDRERGMQRMYNIMNAFEGGAV